MKQKALKRKQARISKRNEDKKMDDAQKIKSKEAKKLIEEFE